MKKIINSIYFRFTTLFLIALFLASSLSLIYSVIIEYPKIKELAENQIIEKLDALNSLVVNEDITLDKAMEYLNIEEDNCKVFDNVDEVNEDFTSQERTALESGNITIVRYKIFHNYELSGIMKINDKYVAYSPSINENQVRIFANTIGDTITSFLVIASFILLIVISMIMKPIKKMSKGLNLVAKGDYDIKLPFKGNNQISELFSNFNKMTEELKSNEYLNREFASNVSHEFKTPITSIKGYAKLLANGKATAEEINEYSNIIASESERLSNLSKNMLKLSELNSASIIKINDEFRPDEQIRKILLLLQKQWEVKNLTIDIEIDEITYTGNEELTYQVWLNLISNAIKFSRENGNISIKLTRKDKLFFEIIDCGIGMSEETQKNLFTQFYVGDRSRSSGSTGLGLYITKRIVEKLNGAITFESKENEGSKFTIVLP